MSEQRDIRDMQAQIKSTKSMIELLELRLFFIDENKINKTKYQKNEDEIIKIKTISQIEKLQAVVFQLENEFIILCNQ